VDLIYNCEVSFMCCHVIFSISLQSKDDVLRLLELSSHLDSLRVFRRAQQ